MRNFIEKWLQTFVSIWKGDKTKNNFDVFREWS